MKKILLLMSLLPLGVLAQSETPFKKANTIEVHTSLTPEQAYKQLALSLQENGYGIASSDRDLGTISTDQKATKHIFTKLNASVRGDSTAVIVLKGTISALNTASPIEFRGMNGSPLMLGWDQMEAVARSLPSDKVLYR